MSESIEGKLHRLEEAIKAHPSALICYSGGVDSTLLAVVAHRVLRERMGAVIINSSLLPPREFRRAKDLASLLGLPLTVIDADELALPGFANNPEDRCYVCKKYRLEIIGDRARAEGFAAVMDGSNADDVQGHRPGRRAVLERGGVSPLEEAELSKQDIRTLARSLGLPNWDQPSRPCLATRFAYDTELNPELIRRVDAAEEELEGLGLREFRVRLEGLDAARIEVAVEELGQLVEKDNRDRLVKNFKDLGFKRILLDLEGYRSGSMDMA